MADTIYGVPKNVYFSMSSKERLMVKREWMQERAERATKKKRARFISGKKKTKREDEAEVTPQPDETGLPSIYDSDVLRHQVDERYTGVTPVQPYPPPPGQYSGVGAGGTATPEQLEDVSRPRKGIIPIGLPPSQEDVAEEREAALYRGSKRAEEEAEQRVQTEVVGRFEETYTPGAQDIANDVYNSIMDAKARELGMVRGVDEQGNQVWYYTSELQLQSFEDYKPVAEEAATLRAQSWISDQWSQYGTEQKVENIYEEEYRRERIAMVDAEEGFMLMPMWQYRREQRYGMFKEDYEQFEKSNDIAAGILGLLGTWTSGDPLGLRTLGETLFGEGTARERSQRVREIRYRTQFELYEAKRTGGLPTVMYKFVEPGTPLFTVGSTAAMAYVLGAGVGVVSKITEMGAKAAEVAMGGYFLGRAAAEVEQITKGQTIKWGGLLGLTPVGLQAREQPMTVGERTSQLGLMALSIPFAAWGYGRGVHAGRKFAGTFYEPKYSTIQDVKVKKIPTRETAFGWEFEGTAAYYQSRVRTLFGKELKFTRTVQVGESPVSGLIAKKQTIFYDPISGKGKLVPAGSGIYTFSTKKISIAQQGLFGIWWTKKVPGGGLFTIEPPRKITVDVGKQTGVSIQPWVKQTDIMSVFIKQPKMSLTLTKAQMAAGVLKPDVASRYYPITGVTKTSVMKGVSQTWELPKGKGVSVEPRMETVLVKYFEAGKPILKYGMDEVDTLLYGFAPGKDPAKVFVRETSTGKEPVDMFGRKGPGAISSVIRHELTHQMYPWMSELEVQLVSSTYPLPPKTRMMEVAKEFHTTVDVETISKLRATIKPKLDRAVKTYWKTGELPIKIQTGLETYTVTPYRQISITKSEAGITTTRVFGVGKTLQSIQKPDSNIINYFTERPHPPAKGPQPQQPTTIEKYITLPFEPQIQIPDVWGATYKPGTIPLLTILSASQTDYQRLNAQSEITLIKYNQTPLQDILTERLQIQQTEQLPTIEQQQVQPQIQAQLQAQLPMLLTATVSPTITITPPPPPPPMLLLQLQSDMQQSMQPQSFQVQLKKRTYKSGKRIRPDTWYNLPGVYNLYDAHAVGMHKVDKTEKASYKLIPTERKPQKRPRGTPNYLSQAHEFYRNPKGIMVEQITSRIDSPGEINAISRRGWEARKRSRRKTNSIVNKIMRIKL